MSNDYDDDDNGEGMEIEIYLDEDDGEDYLDYVDMDTVELEFAWTCPKCKKLNFLRYYELGDYSCGFCEHEVTIVARTPETKQ